MLIKPALWTHQGKSPGCRPWDSGTHTGSSPEPTLTPQPVSHRVPCAPLYLLYLLGGLAFHRGHHTALCSGLRLTPSSPLTLTHLPATVRLLPGNPSTRYLI